MYDYSKKKADVVKETESKGFINNNEQEATNSADVFYRKVEEPKGNQKDYKMIASVSLIAVVLAIVTYFAAAAISGGLALIVWGLFKSSLAYFVIQYGGLLAIAIVMFYFFQKMILSWFGSVMYRNLFLVVGIGFYILVYVYALAT